MPAHQLTPFVMLGVLTALVLLAGRNCRPAAALRGAGRGVGRLPWPSRTGPGTSTSCSGGVGGVGGNVSNSVSGRIQGGESDAQAGAVTPGCCGRLGAGPGSAGAGGGGAAAGCANGPCWSSRSSRSCGFRHAVVRR
ncbi:hypothetical protein LT493_05900 [Streptomyces tricolor]|nr:hypothetical protein [Streptomyces tricolor]